MSHLSSNLSAIAGALGAAPRLPADDGRVRLNGAGLGPVLTISTPNGARVSLNSAEDPVGEAIGIVDATLAGKPKPSVIVALGLGLGFVIDALEQRYPVARILAMEPEPGCVRHLLERRDLTAMLSTRRLLLLWGPDYLGASEAWKFLGQHLDSPPIVPHSLLYRANPAPFVAAMKIVKQITYGAQANAEARKKFAGRYLLNTLMNLRTIARSGDVGALFGAFDGVPGIIVSAGPSLDANLRELAVVSDRGILIAVDTALRPLLAAGIHPHVVVAVDPSELNGRHLQNLPDTAPTHLVAEGSLDPAAFPEFGDRVFTFKVSQHEPWPWLQSLGVERATLRAWGSVATTAFDLALRLGCNPIVFAGQDLAYTGGRPYCHGTTFEPAGASFNADRNASPEILANRHSGGAAISLTDLNGDVTFTTPTLVAFRDWLVEQCSQTTGRRFVNATGSGILMGRGLEQGSLTAAIPPYTPSLNAFAILRAARDRSGTAPVQLEAAVSALLRDTDSGTYPAPLRTWQQFGGETITIQGLRAAFAAFDDTAVAAASKRGLVLLSHASLGVLTRMKGLGRRRALPSVSLRAERITGIRAVARGDEVPAWAVAATIPPVLNGANLEALIDAATHALFRVLSLPDPVRGLLPGHESLGKTADDLSLTALYDWSQAARADVDLIEHAVRLATERIGNSEKSASDAFRWSVAPSTQPPFLDLGSALPIADSMLTWWARRALIVEWAGLLEALPTGATGDLADAAGHLAEWIRDLADGPVHANLDDASSTLHGRLEGDGGNQQFRFELRTPPWRHMRALTGALVRVAGDHAAPDIPIDEAPTALQVDLDADGTRRIRVRCSVVLEPSRVPGVHDPRNRFFDRRDAWRLPAVLDLPRSYMACRLDDDSALVTPYLERMSWKVDATGRRTALVEWPYPIVGERRGPDASSVAWSNVGSGYLMRRPSNDAPVETIVAPFRAGRAVVLEDGTSLWCATTGGLWRWALDGTIDCVAPTPPVSGIAVSPEGIRLDPMPRDGAAQGNRRILTHGWLWCPESGVLEAIELGPLGQMSSRTNAKGWWASAHPAVDIIRLGDATGPLWDLACDWPHDVAWAGDSLVAATQHGTVLLFTDLAHLLRTGH